MALVFVLACASGSIAGGSVVTHPTDPLPAGVARLVYGLDPSVAGHVLYLEVPRPTLGGGIVCTLPFVAEVTPGEAQVTYAAFDLPPGTYGLRMGGPETFFYAARPNRAVYVGKFILTAPGSSPTIALRHDLAAAKRALGSAGEKLQMAARVPAVPHPGITLCPP